MKVYIVHGESGTCPSDSRDWVEAVYESKEDAEAYAIAHSAPPNSSGMMWYEMGGPWYEVKEHDVIPRGDAMMAKEPPAS
jgi:hypothetical protein